MANVILNTGNTTNVNSAYYNENELQLIYYNGTIVWRAMQAPEFSISAATLNIEGATGSGSFTYSYNGDGIVTATSSDASVATASVDTSTKTVTVTYVSAGTATITVTAPETSKFYAVMEECLVTCSKSASSITLSSDTLTVMGASETGTFTFSYVGDGTLDVSSSATGVCTVSRNGTTVTVTYVTAGSATVTVSITDGVKYSGTSESCSVTCSRSASSISLSTSTLSIAGATGSGTFTFSYTGDGTLGVTSSATGVCTVSRNGTTVTVTYVTAGTSTVTVSIGDGTKYAATSKACAVTCSRSGRSLTVSRTSASLTGPSPTATFTISFNGDSQLDYASNNTNIAAITLNKRSTGATGTITRKANGTCTITVSVPQTAKYNYESKTVSVTCTSGTIVWYVQHHTWGTFQYNTTWNVAFSSLVNTKSKSGRTDQASGDPYYAQITSADSNGSVREQVYNTSGVLQNQTVYYYGFLRTGSMDAAINIKGSNIPSNGTTYYAKRS